MIKAYTVDGVADVLSCSRGHVYDLIRKGEIKAFKIGERRGLRVRPEEVERWQKERELTSETGSDSAGAVVIGLPTTAIKALAKG